ncbi:glycosyltransferase family 2 protein [Paenibacillus tritici]|uniref:tetratricopeptide repeat-containing glycosyltransferase family 2 protein n=1 Tax=Paenibacillus tritici TaxID=1873425 RepID=UPI001BA62E41|nr:glycosyltransferase family 2 protein [Paenibacillus tritici]QUL53254.1 glycosyltransferase family 2 protein [Paenibacillus tritici]
MATISLCLIVKNEEQNLDQCLSSVQGIPDEIIIVDTGSTDRTKEIAAKWTQHIYDFEWIDDFSAARNESFKYATKDYILWLDADDIVTPENKIKLEQLKEALTEEVDAVSMNYEIPQDDSRRFISNTTRLRLVKRNTGFSWKGIVHEDITTEAPYHFMKSDITVTHTKVGDAQGGRALSRRNLDIYERHLAQGYVFTVPDMLNYARECHSHKLYKQAIHYYELCKDHPEIPLENRVFILHKLATCYVYNNQPEKELELTLEALSMDVPYPAFSCRMGEHFLKSGNLEAAIFWYRSAYSSPPGERYSWSPIDHVYHTWLPHQQLSLCYEALGDTAQAKHHQQWAEFYRKE